MCSSVKLTSSRLGRGVSGSTNAYTHKYPVWTTYSTYGNSFAYARSWQQTESRAERYVHMKVDFLNRYLSACPIPSAW